MESALHSEPVPAPRTSYRHAEEIHQLIRERIRPHFPTLASCRSTQELEQHPVFRRIEGVVRDVLTAATVDDYTPGPAPAKPGYRLVAWNIERGMHFEKQLAALQGHPALDADVILLTEADIGMARSGNRHVAQDLARGLGMHCAFAPCYLNLAKGAGVEREITGENELGLHGNAVLSRYPLRRVRAVELPNGRDKMLGREKRIGRQIALLADVKFPNYAVTVASVHLDAMSSQPHRCRQMRRVLESLDTRLPTVIGGDWNTTTYNSSSAYHAIMGFWKRVFMGVDHVIRNHYLHPYNRFERPLFRMLEEHGFDWRECNALGVRTTSYDVRDIKAHKNLREWVPAWCFAFIRWALRNHDGRCPFKIDWFAARDARCRNPVVVDGFREGCDPPLSDHDPIAVDLLAGEG